MNSKLIKQIIENCEEIGKEVDSIKETKLEILGEQKDAGATE